MGYGHYGQLTFGFQGRIRHLSEEDVESAIEQFGSEDISVRSLWTEWDQDFGYVVYVHSFSNEMVNARRFGYSFPESISLPTSAEEMAEFAESIESARTELTNFYNWLVEQNSGTEDEDGMPSIDWVLTSMYG